MFEKKWFRFLVFTVPAVVAFIIMLVNASTVTDKYDAVKGYMGSGITALLGCAAFMLAFDMLGDTDSSIGGFFRFIFMAAGWGLAIAGAVVSVALNIGSTDTWLMSWIINPGLGLAATYILYRFALVHFWNDIILSFVPAAGIGSSYVVCLLLSAIGKKALFLYKWTPVIIFVGLVVVIVLFIKREGFPYAAADKIFYTDIVKEMAEEGVFDEDKKSEDKKPASTRKTSGSSGSEDPNAGKQKGTGKEVERAVKSLRWSDFTDTYDNYYRWKGNPKVTVAMHSIFISGTIIYDPWGYAHAEDLTRDDYEDAQARARDKSNEIEDRICSAVRSTLRELSESYYGYNYNHSVSVNVRYEVKRP